MKKLLLFLLPLLFPALLLAAEPKADKIRVDVTNFNKNLGVGNSTVQSALETLDDMTTTGGGGSGSVSDAAYGAGWSGIGTTAPSQNAVYDKIEGLSSVYLGIGSTAANSALFDGHLPTYFQVAGNYLTGVTADSPLSGSGTAASHLVVGAGTTSVTGILQLSNNYAGTSQTLATTEKALSDGLATKQNTGSYLTAVASDSDWTVHGSYPAACGAGQYATQIGDTLTCSTPTGTSQFSGTDPIYYNGKVGIGATAPLGLLQVGTNPDLPGLLVLSTGKVGVGTTNPAYNFEVKGTISADTVLSGGLVVLTSYTETDPVVKALTGIITSNGSTISAITDSHTNWDTAYTDRLKWDGGNVGLNDTTARTSLNLGTIATQSASNVNITAGTGDFTTLKVGGANVLTSFSEADTLGTVVARGAVSPLNTNVGIGCTSPTALLQVGTPPFSGLAVLAGGNVGIGNTNPGTKLQVNGNAAIGTGTSAPANGLAVTGAVQAGGTGTFGGLMVGANTVANSGNNLSFFAASTSANLLGVLNDETGTGLAVFATAPTFTTSITAPLIYGSTAPTGTLTLQTTSGAGTTQPAFYLKVGNNGATTALTVRNDGKVGIANTNPSLGVFQIGTVPGNGLVVLSNGNVGIGTTNPTYPLDIANINGIRIAGTEPWSVAGKLGIGTTNPTTSLEIVPADTVAGFYLNISGGKIKMKSPNGGIWYCGPADTTGVWGCGS
jgi:hypothetical protein